MEKHTVMKVVCAWCGVDMGTKDGQGQTGTTHGMCRKCAKKELAKLPKEPAKWNLVGRFLERRRMERRLAEDREALRRQTEAQVEEREALFFLIENNPNLHALVMLKGRRLAHYLEMEDLANVAARATDQPEIKCKWN